MNRFHLRRSDYDDCGDILPMGYKRLKDGTIIETECMGEDAKASIPDDNSCWWDGYNTAKKLFERPHGEWVFHTYMPHKPYCSICEKDSPYGKLWDFCPNCGADIGGGKEC